MAKVWFSILASFYGGQTCHKWGLLEHRFLSWDLGSGGSSAQEEGHRSLDHQCLMQLYRVVAKLIGAGSSSGSEFRLLCHFHRFDSDSTVVCTIWLISPLVDWSMTTCTSWLISPSTWNCFASSPFPMAMSAHANFSCVGPLFSHQSSISVRHSCAKSGECWLLAWICSSLWWGTPSCSPSCLHLAATGSFTRSLSSNAGRRSTIAVQKENTKSIDFVYLARGKGLSGVCLVLIPMSVWEWGCFPARVPRSQALPPGLPISRNGPTGPDRTGRIFFWTHFRLKLHQLHMRN